MSKILIAFSCGPDSVYLYHKLKKEGHELGICYINHNLRDDVHLDLEFINKFSIENSVPYYVRDINLESFSEDKARILRYQKLEEVRKDNGYEYIATGHNKNDNVETVIFRMIRGTGIDGLKGIPRKRGKIIRPMLDISKEEVLEYLDNNNINYRIDYTNNENKYSRNKIRNQIFPIMKQINEGFISNISRLIENINEDNREKEEILEVLKSYDIHISSNKLNEILSIKGKSGQSIDLNEEYVWYCGYEYYGIKKRNEVKEDKNGFLLELKLNDEISVNNFEIKLLEYSKMKIYLEKKEYRIYNVGSINNIIVRNRRDGDRLDNKKVKEIFINKKVDRYERNNIPLVVANDKVIAIGDIKYSKKLTKEINEKSFYLLIGKRGRNFGR